MAQRNTLDTRRCLYGEPRLSDPQVRMLRQIVNGATVVQYGPTFFALVDRWLANGGPKTASGVIATITERGRKILAAIDPENACPTNKSEL